MWGHKAIADISRLIPKLEPFAAGEMRRVVAGIQNAVHFHVGSVEDLDRAAWGEGRDAKHVFKGELAEGIRLPFQECWFEFEVHSIFPDSPPVRIAALAREHGEPDVLRIDPFHFAHGPGQWFPTNAATYVIVGSTFEEKPEFTQWLLDGHRKVTGKGLSENGRMNFSGNAFRMPISPALRVPDEIIDGVKRWDHMAVTGLNLFLLLLSCKNIGTEEIPAPERLNKKRRKAGKQPLFSYRVLNITVPGAGKRRGNSEAAGDGGVKRLHMCRGHFKTYTAGNPLFGRLTGRYWWEPHVRGDKAAGMVAKEYRAKIRKDGG